MWAEVVAGLVAGGVSLAVSGVTAVTTSRLQRQRLQEEAERARRDREASFEAQEARLRAEAEMSRRDHEATMLAQEARLRTELRTEFMAEEAIQNLLRHEKYELRTFEAISRRLPGFDPDELRRLLVRAGALAFYGDAEKEMWGLRDRNRHRLDREGGQG
ncbi:MAG: hypothetical protein QOH83_1410 [Solirubrobacteraceae bacterium]|jgi:hypothetical protein|nr:hypothetical protein [Solirubrobacteraceae bacterium]